MTKAEKRRCLPMYSCFLKGRPQSSVPFVFRDRAEAAKQFREAVPENCEYDHVVLAGFWDPLTGKVFQLPRGYVENPVTGDLIKNSISKEDK